MTVTVDKRERRPEVHPRLLSRPRRGDGNGPTGPGRVDVAGLWRQGDRTPESGVEQGERCPCDNVVDPAGLESAMRKTGDRGPRGAAGGQEVLSGRRKRAACWHFAAIADAKPVTGPMQAGRICSCRTWPEKVPNLQAFWSSRRRRPNDGADLRPTEGDQWRRRPESNRRWRYCSRQGRMSRGS